MKIDNPNDQLGFLLTQVTFLKQRITNAALRELDITYIQFVILLFILNALSSKLINQFISILVNRKIYKLPVIIY